MAVKCPASCGVCPFCNDSRMDSVKAFISFTGKNFALTPNRWQMNSAAVNAATYDNGTFSLIEATYFGKPVICSRYPFVTVTTPQTQQDVMQEYGLPKHKVRLLPLGSEPKRRFAEVDPEPITVPRLPPAVLPTSPTLWAS